MRPDFDFFKKAFNKFAQKHNSDDITARAIRSVAHGVKGTADKLQEEFPKDFIKELVQDFYDIVTSQDIADGISSQIRSLDEGQIDELLSGVTSKLKDPQIAGEIAKQVKQFLDQNSTDDLMGAMEAALDAAKLDMGSKFMAQAMLRQAKPVLDNMKNSDVEDIKYMIIEAADSIPSEFIADQVAELTRHVTPERISKAAHDAVGKLPSANTVTNIFHGVAKSLSTRMDELSKITDSKQAPGIIKKLGQDHRNVVDKAANDDQKSKNTFNKKKGQDFKF